MTVLTPVAIAAIQGYRRFLSPHKGFRCPHGILYGSSCSDVGLELFTHHHPRDAFRMLAIQLQKCRIAGELVSASGAHGEGYVCHCPALGKQKNC